MYLLAPISLVMLNPIGFIILEIGRANNWDTAVEGSSSSEPPEHRSKWRILFQVQCDEIGRNFTIRPIYFSELFCQNNPFNDRILIFCFFSERTPCEVPVVD
jgi:hypothetical protein